MPCEVQVERLHDVGQESLGGEEVRIGKGLCTAAAAGQHRRGIHRGDLRAARKTGWQLRGVALEVLARQRRVVAAIDADGAEERIAGVLAQALSREFGLRARPTIDEARPARETPAAGAETDAGGKSLAKGADLGGPVRLRHVGPIVASAREAA